MCINKKTYLTEYLERVNASLDALNEDDLNYNNYEDLRTNLRNVYQEKIKSIQKQLDILAV